MEVEVSEQDEGQTEQTPLTSYWGNDQGDTSSSGQGNLLPSRQVVIIIYSNIKRKNEGEEVHKACHDTCLLRNRTLK